MNFWDWSVWNYIVQFGFLCGVIVFSNILRRKTGFLRKAMLPTSLIAGLIILALKSLNLLHFLDLHFLDGLTYHAIALGFIALSLKQNYGKKPSGKLKDGLNSGATIVGTYLLQGFLGLGITISISVLFAKWLFPASGILLALGFGQGPGQSNNFGKVYESLGFNGGQSFALSIASIGTLIGSVFCVILVSVLRKKGKIKAAGEKAAAVLLEKDPEDEMPLSEPVDRLTMNIGTIMIIFLAVCGFLFGVDRVCIASGLLGNFGINTIRPLLFGFNFIFGTLFALLYKKIFITIKKKGYVKHEYTNNQTLNRISGTLFDFMILCSVVLIDISVLAKLIPVLVIICAVGTVATYFYVMFISEKIASDYYLEYFLAMFGMLTGTISTGMAMLRLTDPNFETKASDNLVTGSAFAIVLGFPLMLLLSLAPLGLRQACLTLGILAILFLLINVLLFRSYLFKKKNTRMLR